MSHPAVPREAVAMTFSLRLDKTESMDLVKAKVETAFGCTMSIGELAGVPVWVCEILGIRIAIGLWRGIDGAHVYQLHGDPSWQNANGVPFREIRIDAAIIDLLRAKKAGHWRQPTPEEMKAEGLYDLEDI